MSERKVLNKYYPPDFDPSKIPRLHLPKDRQYTVRLMAPCNMRCKTCGEYIYKGKKFNARKETVQGEEYLGIKIFRFYIKCTRCLAEITFKTDPQNADYIVEHGATRNFQALKLAEEQAEREQKDLEEEEAGNPMKLLENRTKASKREMEIIESLEELRDLNQRQARVDFDGMLKMCTEDGERLRLLQEREDEEFIRTAFGRPLTDSENDVIIKRLSDEESDEDDEEGSKTVTSAAAQVKEAVASTDVFVEKNVQPRPEVSKVWERSVGSFRPKSTLSGLVRAKKMRVEEKPDDPVVCKPSSTSGLNLLGAYSSSDEDPPSPQ